MNILLQIVPYLQTILVNTAAVIKGCAVFSNVHNKKHKKIVNENNIKQWTKEQQNESIKFIILDKCISEIENDKIGLVKLCSEEAMLTVLSLLSYSVNLLNINELVVKGILTGYWWIFKNGSYIPFNWMTFRFYCHKHLLHTLFSDRFCLFRFKSFFLFGN